MASNLINILKIKELRQRIFFTIGILIIYRIGAQIPVPGVNFESLKLLVKTQAAGTNPLFEYFNFFAGGAFKYLSIFALGIMPYITTSIIMQLLLLIFPTMKRLSEEEGGRKKINQYTRMGTVLVCLVQSFMTINYLEGLKAYKIIAVEPEWLFYLSTILVTSTGTMVLMWLGERITEKGIGNGISLIIFAGIVARVPEAMHQLYNKREDIGAPIILMILIIYVFIIALVIYEQQGQRKIPVNYAKRIIGRKVYGSPNTYLPLKINPSGVIPIIFASSMLVLPQTVASMFPKIQAFQWIAGHVTRESAGYFVFYSLMIIAFSYFYTQVSMNPIEIAKNIRENGGSIPGVPINKMQDHLARILNRIVLPGSIFLAFIAIIPSLVLKFFQDFPAQFAYLLGGTSLIIIVGVALDTISQIESHLKMHHYDGLTKKGKIRSRNF
jgi:preprotein translocase subunit SecY